MPRSRGGAAAGLDPSDARFGLLLQGLRALESTLRKMVDGYRRKPESVEASLDSVEAVVLSTYDLLVPAFRSGGVLWARRREESQFLRIHQKVVDAIATFKPVRDHYRALEKRAGQHERRLQAVGEDSGTRVAYRRTCIAAISDFQRYVSGLLAGLERFNS